MAPSKRSDLDGILIIDKPAGITSHDVVDRIRRLLDIKRVGHGGTLDPFATGVLPVAVGRATRVLQYVQNADKGYQVTAELGAETDSGDTEGTVVQRQTDEQWPSRDQLDATLARFLGEIEQIPPAHSAIKVDGEPLYRRARAGAAVEAPLRRVVIHAIDVVHYEPPMLTLDITCAKGTYIRALVRDIGRALGSYAYCRELRRTRTGPFTLAQAHTLADLSGRDVRAEWTTVALPPDAALNDLPRVTLSGRDTNAWYHGRSVVAPADADVAIGAATRVYCDPIGFAGVGVIGSDGRIAPSFVLTPGMGNARRDDHA